MRKIIAATLAVTLLVLIGCSQAPGADAPSNLELTVTEPVSAETPLEFPSFACTWDTEHRKYIPISFDEVSFERAERLPEGITRDDLYAFDDLFDGEVELPCELDEGAVPEEGFAYLKVHMRLTNPADERIWLSLQGTGVARYDADAQPGLDTSSEGTTFTGKGAYTEVEHVPFPLWVSPGENFTVTSKRSHPIERELYPHETNAFDAYYLLPEEDLASPDLCWLVERNGGAVEDTREYEERAGETLHAQTYAYRVELG